MSTTLYSNSSPTVIPVFPGSVQGVVVQITIYVSFSSNFPFPSATLNFTYIDVVFTSAYSISASANAVSQSVHQYTGFRPLYI